MGSTIVMAQTESGFHPVEFHIINCVVSPILGLADCLRLGLLHSNHKVHQIDTTQEELLLEYTDLFTEGVGKLPVTYKMTLYQKIPPAAPPPGGYLQLWRLMSKSHQFSRCTCTTFLTSSDLLCPSSKEPSAVQLQLQKLKTQQKQSYNKTAKPLGKLQPKQVERLQTQHGFNKKAVVLQAASSPESYWMEHNGKRLDCNRPHLLPVAEPFQLHNGEASISPPSDAPSVSPPSESPKAINPSKGG